MLEINRAGLFKTRKKHFFESIYIKIIIVSIRDS